MYAEQFSSPRSGPCPGRPGCLPHMCPRPRAAAARAPRTSPTPVDHSMHSQNQLSACSSSSAGAWWVLQSRTYLPASAAVSRPLARSPSPPTTAKLCRRRGGSEGRSPASPRRARRISQVIAECPASQSGGVARLSTRPHRRPRRRARRPRRRRRRPPRRRAWPRAVAPGPVPGCAR